MQNLKVFIGIYSWIFIGLFSIISPQALGSNRKFKNPCFQALEHPAVEIFISSKKKTVQLNDNHRHPFVKRSPKERRNILEVTPEWPQYERILRTAAANLDLYRITLFTLSEIELLKKYPGHYKEWLSFLVSSKVEDLHHRIYEGFHAITLLKTKNVLIRFEPKDGFFYDTQSRKSMDLHLRDPRTLETIAYKEIKRVYRHYSAIGALKSILSKTTEIRPKVGEHVELSGIIYIGSPKDPTIPNSSVLDQEERSLDFLQVSQTAENMLKQKSAHQHHGLDSVILVDLEMEFYTKIYIVGTEVYSVTGAYPLGSYFHFLLAPIQPGD